MARAGICICRGGDTFSALWRALEEPSSWGDPMSGPTPGEADRKHQRQEVPKHLSRCCRSPARPKGQTSLPWPGARRGWWATGPGLHRSRPALGVRGSGVGRAAGGAGAVSAAVGGHRARRLLFILVKMQACSCRAGGAGST